MFRRTLLFATFSLSLACSAQDLGSLAGTWTATFSTPAGVSRTAKVVVVGDSGTWQTDAKNRENPCIGLEAPIAVSKVSAEGFGLAVNGSNALQGCPDSAFEMKRVNDKTYEGQFSDGRKFVLSKK